MRARVIAIGLGLTAVLGFGVWVGRSSQAPAVADSRSASPAARALAESGTGALASKPGASPSLARTPPAAVAPGLAADLISTDPRIRRAAVAEVARSSDADPAVLLVASRDPDLEVGAIATEALGRRYAEGQVPLREMVARATDHSLNERVRASALNGLGLVPHVDAAGILIELLGRGDVMERRTAAILLAHQDPELAVPALIGALADADQYVRENANEALRARARGRDFGSDAAAWRAWWQARPR